jgi:hypothetical protein
MHFCGDISMRHRNMYLCGAYSNMHHRNMYFCGECVFCAIERLNYVAHTFFMRHKNIFMEHVFLNEPQNLDANAIQI